MNAHANTTVERPAPLLGGYYRGTESDNAVDAADRKLAQAEALAHLLCGEAGEALRSMNDEIQDTIGWLLSDLIGEYRLFRYKADQEAASARTEATA